MRSATLSLFVSAALIGCGPNLETTVNGTVDGAKFTVGAAYWGGPYILVTEQELDCLDVSWTSYFYDDEHPPGDVVKRFLQFTFVESDVIEGNHQVAGQSAVDGMLVEFDQGIVTVAPARIGQLLVDEFDKKDNLFGTFELEFDTGSLDGILEVPYCTNLKG